MKFGNQGPDYPAGCAVVFGASGGLGAASAGLIAQRGSDVVLTYRSRPGEAEKLAREIEALGRGALVVQCDVTQFEQVEAVIAAALARFGRVHTAVSAGGLVFDTGPMAEFRDASFRGVIETDVYGFYNITRAAVPAMRKAGGGSIVALVTCAVSRTVANDGLSATPKAAVATMVKQIAAEEGRAGIRANAVGPAVIEGGMVIPLRETPAKALLDMAVDFTPMGRLGTCEEVAEVVAFLASSKASYVTGQIVMVDGGLAV
jgi:NAD(P)-dependent dehydrogenase (short-subunit alcohol dehydrogenase family)